MVVLQYDAALLQAGYKASTYLSPNHSLKDAWTSKRPINQLMQLGGNNNNYRYMIYDLVSLSMIILSVTFAILNEFLILLSLPLCLSLHQKNLIKVLYLKHTIIV